MSKNLNNLEREFSMFFPLFFKISICYTLNLFFFKEKNTIPIIHHIGHSGPKILYIKVRAHWMSYFFLGQSLKGISPVRAGLYLIKLESQRFVRLFGGSTTYIQEGREGLT